MDKPIQYPVTDEDFTRLVSAVAKRIAPVCGDNQIVYDRLTVREKGNEFMGAVVIMRGVHTEPLFHFLLAALRKMQSQGDADITTDNRH